MSEGSEVLFGGRALVDVDLYYTVEKTASGAARVVVLEDDQAFKMLTSEDNKERVKKIGTKWRLLTWAVSNNLLEQSTKFDHLRNDEAINWTRYRDQRLKSSLVEWDCKDKDGNPIPLTEHAIDNLHANIAIALLTKYDEKIRLDKEEQAKN